MKCKTRSIFRKRKFQFYKKTKIWCWWKNFIQKNKIGDIYQEKDIWER